MADRNDAVFDFAQRVITQEVVQKASRNAENFRRRVEEQIRIFFEDFYKGMINGPEGRNRYQRVWENVRPYALEYEDRKFREGRPSEFFEYKGGLIEHLLARSPTRDLGTPTARFSARQKGGGSAVFIDRAGRAQYAAGSGRRGFAGAGALAGLAFSIEIDMLPKLQGQDYDMMIQKMTSGHNTLKLSAFEKGTSKQKGRPLVEPFTRWYTTVGLRNKLREKFQIEI